MSERQSHRGGRDVGGKPKRLDWRKTAKESVQFLFCIGRPNWTIFQLLRLMESLQIHWRTDFRFFFHSMEFGDGEDFSVFFFFSVEKC